MKDPKRMTAAEAAKMFDDEFKRRQDEDRRAHESVMRGFVIPVLEAGLVDDVEPTKKP